jgi:hypothetical protein
MTPTVRFSLNYCNFNRKRNKPFDIRPRDGSVQTAYRQSISRARRGARRSLFIAALRWCSAGVWLVGWQDVAQPGRDGRQRVIAARSRPSPPGTGRFQPGLASWRRMFRIWGLLLALALCAALTFFLIEVWQIVEFINR